METIEDIVQDGGYRYEQELTLKGVPADREGFQNWLRNTLTNRDTQTRENLKTALDWNVNEATKKRVLGAFDALQDNK